MAKPHSESAAPTARSGGASSDSVLLSSGPSDHNPTADLTQPKRARWAQQLDEGHT